MSVEANLPSRRIFWWAYSLYVLLAITVGSYFTIVNGGYPVVAKLLSVGLDAIGLLCFYFFLRQKPFFTRGFWILFSIIYTIKSAIGLAILASVAIHTTWDGSNFSHIVLMDFVIAILDLPFLIAIILYAFDSEKIWAISRGEIANA